MNRSIVRAWLSVDGVEVLCDCGMTTVLQFAFENVTETVEMAFTCDGCLSVHWYTLVPDE